VKRRRRSNWNAAHAKIPSLSCWIKQQNCASFASKWSQEMQQKINVEKHGLDKQGNLLQAITIFFLEPFHPSLPSGLSFTC
jgi:hypothetical protein